MRRVHPTAVLLATVLGLGGSAATRCALAAGNPYPGYHSAIYSDPANWLCRPGKDDVCDHDLDATVIKANGHTRIEKFHLARQPKFDCFYIYPTISTDPGGNSDLIPGANQELFVVRQQAARLGEVCRVFAPVYRQITLTALLANLGGNPIPNDPALAFGDVLDAWKHYIANDNQGRGVVLIGHSQGAGQLTALLRTEIDPNPDLRALLISAMLLGTNFQVPVGEDVGGSLQNIPLCHGRSDTGCVVTYASFRSTAPPPANSLFGRSSGPGRQSSCTNPAALGGGKVALRPYLPTNGATLPILPVPPSPPWVQGKQITTPFVTLPRLLEAECAERDGFVYLEITVNGDPTDARIDNIGGDLTPEWGLHLVDVNESMGDLVALARSQAHAFRAKLR